MADDGRVITAKLPEELASELDDIAGRIDRSKSWIVREAVSQWLAEEQRRYELTLEGLADVDAGRTISHEEAVIRATSLKRARHKAARAKTAA